MQSSLVVDTRSKFEPDSPILGQHIWLDNWPHVCKHDVSRSSVVSLCGPEGFDLEGADINFIF